MASRRSLALAALTAGVAWLARPDLLLPPAVATAWLALDVRWRARHLAQLGAMAAGWLLVLAGLWWIYGTALPNAFWVKTWAVWQHSPWHTETDRAQVLRPLGTWLRHDAPVAVAAVVLAVGAGTSSPRAKALLLGAWAFVAWHTLATVQVMGHFGRFYAPMWPVFALIAADLAVRAPLTRLNRMLALGLAASAAVGAATLGWRTWSTPSVARQAIVAQMHAPHIGTAALDQPYFALGGWVDWPMLEEVGALPATCAVATVDLGRPATMLGLRRVVDLSGLQDTTLARRGWDVPRFLQNPPAIVWFGLGTSQAFVRPLVTDARFLARYDVVATMSWGAAVQTALLRSGPCAMPARAALERARLRSMSQRSSAPTR